MLMRPALALTAFRGAFRLKQSIEKGSNFVDLDTSPAFPQTGFPRDGPVSWRDCSF
jgi:hypothetical protein